MNTEPEIDQKDKLRQLKAYKVGYDLGWYRALESVSGDLQEIVDAILNSATFKEIEREYNDKPIFLAKIMSIITTINEMRSENLPTLIVERKAITILGARLQEVLMKDPKALDDSVNTPAQLFNPKGKD